MNSGVSFGDMNKFIGAGLLLWAAFGLRATVEIDEEELGEWLEAKGEKLLDKS